MKFNMFLSLSFLTEKHRKILLSIYIKNLTQHFLFYNCEKFILSFLIFIFKRYNLQTLCIVTKINIFYIQL